MSLFQAERHEALSGGLWREDRAREAIARIVADTHQGFSAEGLWPIHSFDRSEERPPDSLKSLYHGAAGVIWALDHLAKTGADHRPARLPPGAEQPDRAQSTRPGDLAGRGQLYGPRAGCPFGRRNRHSAAAGDSPAVGRVHA